MIILILTATEINRDVEQLSQQWTNIAEKPISKEVQDFIDELNMNTNCCHSTTKTFTRNPLTDEGLIDPATRGNGNASSDDAHVSTAQKQPITIFMSYSVPKSVWQNLWAEAAKLKQPIQFVLRGLPGNSFQELAKKVMDYGCPVLIDPPLFERYKITAVPAFLVKVQGVTKQHSSDKQDHNQNQAHKKGHPRQETVFFGNVSLTCVIEKGAKTTTKEIAHRQSSQRALMTVVQEPKETRS